MWIAFTVVHAWIGFCGVWWVREQVFWDLGLYRAWAWYGVHTGVWPVLNTAWVYPAGALVPIAGVNAVAGYDDATFALGWMVVVTALNAYAVQRLLRRPGGKVGAMWWVVFLAVLGTIAFGRLDAFVAPLTILGLLALAERPRLASVLLTIGAWIKVAPGAVLLPIVLAVKRPWREIVAPAVAVSAVVVGVVGALGGLGHVSSFLFTQGDRGLQVESVGATPWVIAGLFSRRATIDFNAVIYTYEVHGPGVATMTKALDLLFAVTMLAVAVALWHRRLAGSNPLPAGELVVRGSLLVLLTMIVTNKVLSPQYISWLAGPVAVALAMRLPRWRRTGWAVLAIGGATQIIFPWLYSELVVHGRFISLVLAARNLGLVVLWVATARTLWVEPASTQETALSGPPRSASTRSASTPPMTLG